MTDTIRIKRRATGGAAGAPSSLAASELAYNEVDDTLWYGKGNSGGTATSIVKAGGQGNFVQKAGDTMTGSLSVAPTGAVEAYLTLNKPSGQRNTIYGATAGSNRWIVILGNFSAESGGNVGSDFVLQRCSDAGSVIDNPLIVTRSNGAIQLGSSGAAITLMGVTTLAADPTASLGAATKQYVDTKDAVVFGASGGSHSVGNVPDPGSTAGTTRFLCENATWAVPPSSGGGISDAPSDGTLYGRVNAAWVKGVKLAGDTMTGNLQINGSSSLAAFTLNASASGGQNLYQGSIAGNPRWRLMLGNGAAESSGNLGSDAELQRFTDAGAYIDSPISIARSTGQVQHNGKPAGYALPGMLFGLGTAPNASFPLACLDVAPGGATSDDYTTPMLLGATWTKNITGAFAAGSGAGSGGMDTGTVAANTWYHVWLISTPAGVTDVLFSLSATTPTMPSGYTKKRRIWSVKTNGSSQIIAYSQLGDQCLWTTAVADISNAAVAIGALTSTTLGSVPTGVKVTALITSSLTGGLNTFVLIQALDQPAAAANSPAGNFSLYVQTAGSFAAGDFQIRTNASGQIGVTVNTAIASGFYVVTKGWIDNRGK